jgi:DNA helicase-2/ATP-dependent DNA helicase PcrA
VTCVPEVKGLEFDYVVLPDVAAGRYADTPEARRALYVAATRASTQLVLACSSTPSPLVKWGHPT